MRRDIIVDGQIVSDDWQVIDKAFDAAAELPAGRIIVPLALWTVRRDELKLRGDVGVWLDSDEDVATLSGDLTALPVIALNFPSFRDGRGYSSAFLLRKRYDYKGQIRAIGDVLRDQLFYMKRCGINAYVIRADRDVHDALASLKDFSETYQVSVDQPVPLFRRRQLASA